MKFLSSLRGKTQTEEFPLLPLRELVLFPNTMMSVFITYKLGMIAIDEALKRDLRLFAACLKVQDGGETYPSGSVVKIVQHLKMPDNTFRVVLQGEYRGTIASSIRQNDLSLVRVEPIKPADSLSPETQALMRAVQKAFARYAEYTRKISSDTLVVAEKTESSERLANLICHAVQVKAERKIELLGIADPARRLEAVLETLERENEIFDIQRNISVKVKSRMEKNQRDYILNEQLKEIHKELGRDDRAEDFAELERAVLAKHPPAEVLLKARKELGRLRKLQPFTPEAGILRGYLEWIADLPWADFSPDSTDLASAERILDEDHFSMQKAKDRILEFIAVHELFSLPPADSSQASNATFINQPADDLPKNAPNSNTASSGSSADALRENSSADALPENTADSNTAFSEKKTPAEKDSRAAEDSSAAEDPLAGSAVKGPILCFVGPPGTGKTSLGKSVARALGRRFVRFSLGGLRDEAEIRGHRKTYVGALPGKIIQLMSKAGTLNPVFLLDEIDKISHDARGDPAAALLEALDPEQNVNFADHYLETPYNLSRALFIATANTLNGIPYPLQDRMEIIEIPGYGENEKLSIAQKYLIPKQLRENGLASAKIIFTDDAVRDIIRHRTMESGVRNLEREIARCIRRVAQEAVREHYGRDSAKPLSSFTKTVSLSEVETLLGRRKYKPDLVFKEARIGVSYGLAWTETGGVLLPVESVKFDGSGEVTLTGNLGDVMKESARIALSYLRSTQNRYGFTADLSKTDFHLHVPAGAVPKDGPSAGVALGASLLSLLRGSPVKSGAAMTGELTLTGRILPIGGLKEKLLAAIRNGMNQVLLPAGNRDDWSELDEDVKNSIAVDFVETAEEAFHLLFDHPA
ncbi:MAG: endopeptidase La [Spirochaetaceae bacterium]|jgi:ATP-dependent Lon protease|nr:endopeptidase La [Spirochaetaceae bacterium]